MEAYVDSAVHVRSLELGQDKNYPLMGKEAFGINEAMKQSLLTAGFAQGSMGNTKAIRRVEPSSNLTHIGALSLQP